MGYQSWPTLISRDQRVLYTLLHGHMYKLVPHDDLDVTTRRNPLTLYRDGEVIAEIGVDGKVVDFTVNHDLVVLATIQPAGLYLCRTWKRTAVLYLPISLDTHDKTKQVIQNITLGNYRGNVVALWHGSGSSPVFIGMVSGRDAFRFDPMPLVYYDDYGVQRMYVRKQDERVLAVPHLPHQLGTISIISPNGMKFYSLKPFYTMNELNEEYITHMPFAGIAGKDGFWDEGANSLPDRMQFSSYDLLVQIDGNHLTMKYDPFQAIRKTYDDWIRVFVDGTEVSPSQFIYMTPFNTDRELALEPTVTATDMTIHADLPISFSTTADLSEGKNLSQTGIRFLPKNTQRRLVMRTKQCMTRWQLARFIEKFNIKVRAELWG